MVDTDSVFASALAEAQGLVEQRLTEAIEAAERRGYERGRAERGFADAMARAVAGALSRLEEAIESVGNARERAEAAAEVSTDRVSIPSSGDSLADIAEWLDDHGGRTLYSRGEAGEATEAATDAAEAAGEALRSLRAAVAALQGAPVADDDAGDDDAGDAASAG